MIYSGDEDSFVVTDANPVSKYSFRLRYTTEEDESPFSNPVRVETPESGITSDLQRWRKLTSSASPFYCFCPRGQHKLTSSASPSLLFFVF